MAANITLKCGTGVASITYAWVNSSGTRTPSSGTDTTKSSVTMKACDHVWISSVTASSGYTSPYKIDNTSFTSNYTYYPSVGGTKNVIATKIQTSYKVRLAKYVDNVYQTETTFTTTSQIMSETAVKNKIPSSWASSDIELKDPWFGTLSGCRYDQNEGEFTFTSTSPTINVAYTKIVVPTYNYYLRYHANGGTGEPNTQKTLETTVSPVTFRVSSTEPTRTNYIFLGWSFDSTSTEADYVGGDTVYLYSEKPDRTLYAVWKISVIKPAITYVSHTDTTIKISLDRNGATAGSWIIEASLSNFGTVVYTTTITSTSQTTITLTRLTPEKTYYIRARHVIGDVSASSNVISATTRTSTFQWTSNDSVYVIKSAVFTDAITAAKWNELIKKVNWCRSQKGLSTASLNRATSGQQILATNFTAMRNAIADMRTVTPARSAGDEILATYFANSDTSLKSAINAVITTL